MSGKYQLRFDNKNYEVKDFGDAIVCEGRVFFCEKVEYTINTAPGQCWGVYIDVAAGSCVDGEYSPKACTLCLDDVGQSYTVTELISQEPLILRCINFCAVGSPVYGEDDAKPAESRSRAELRYSICDGAAYVDGFYGAEHQLLVPCLIDGVPVRRLDLRGADLSKVETLIVSEGIEELAINFRSACALRQLYIPNDIRLLCPLDDINRIPWFRALRKEPLIIAGCYCGTPGGGSGGVRSLVLPEGTESVAAGADFHSYWHSIKTPESLRHIGTLAFATNHCLEELNLSEGLCSIADGAFFMAERLKNLHIPDTLPSLGKNCFSRCPSLQEVSVPNETLAELFSVHSLTVRLPGGNKHLSKTPPILIPITNRISAYPRNSGFSAAGRHYNSLSELCAHPLSLHSREFLDTHGRKTWHICVRSDCMYDNEGNRRLLECWYIKSDDYITQIDRVGADGTILVQEGINSLDIPYEMRNIVLHEVFQA